MTSEGIAVELRAADPPITGRGESIGQRYAATLAAQLVQLAASVAGAGIVPRALGAASFGNYNFLLNMAATVRGFTEPSVQQAFFTFSAQEERSGRLTRLYGLWVLLQLAVILLLITTAAAIGWTGRIWPGQRPNDILLITLVDWAAFLVISLKQLGDAKGLTVRPQLIGAVSAVTVLVGIVALAGTGHLTFFSYAMLSLAAAAATAGSLAYWLLVRHGDQCWSGSMRGSVRQSLGRWWAYSRPLILVEYYTTFLTVLSTYFIQFWYGSVEQGQLALATRWSAVVLIFTSAGVMILWREIASAAARHDLAGAGQLYRQFSQLLVFVSLALSTWLACASPTLVTVFAGTEYAGAIPALRVAAYYPLAQTIGQLSTAGLKATGQTTQYRNWALLLSLPDMALTYFLVAPAEARVPGLGLGALGVAIKLTGFALITVGVYEAALMRHLGLSYRRLVSSYLRMAAIVVPVAAASIVLGGDVLQRRWEAGSVAALGFGSLVYFTSMAALAVAFPHLVGVSRPQLRALAGQWIR
jgi:O-antigen/teichoic acid export membrane protein